MSERLVAALEAAGVPSEAASDAEIAAYLASFDEVGVEGQRAAQNSVRALIAADLPRIASTVTAWPEEVKRGLVADLVKDASETCGLEWEVREKDGRMMAACEWGFWWVVAGGPRWFTTATEWRYPELMLAILHGRSLLAPTGEAQDGD